MLLVQLGDQHVPVYFGVLDNFTTTLSVWISFIGRFVKGIFMKECRIVFIRFRPVAIILEHTPLSDPQAELQTDFDIEIDMNCQPDRKHRTPLFRITKCVAVPQNTELPAPFTTSCAGYIYMAPHLNVMRNKMVLLASGTANALSHVPIQTRSPSL